MSAAEGYAGPKIFAVVPRPLVAKTGTESDVACESSSFTSTRYTLLKGAGNVLYRPKPCFQPVSPCRARCQF